MEIIINNTKNLEDIIKGCLKGERTSQNIFYKMFAPKVYTICRRYCYNANSAKELLQDSFIKIFQNMKFLKIEDKIDAWITKIVLHTIMDFFRNKSTFLELDDVDESYIVYEDDQINFEGHDAEELMKMVQELPDRCRTIFNLHAIDGFEHKEIAEMLGINIGTSKSQLARARAMLQEKVLKSDIYKNTRYANSK